MSHATKSLSRILAPLLKSTDARQDITAELSACVMTAAIQYARAGGTKRDFLTRLRVAFDDAAVAVGNRW